MYSRKGFYVLGLGLELNLGLKLDLAETRLNTNEDKVLRK